MSVTQNFWSAVKEKAEIIEDISQGWPTCGSRATCGSLKDYLWLSINVLEFNFHFSVIFKTNYYRSVSVSFVYLCESFYSTFKIREIQTPSVLTNQHLKELPRSAFTNYSQNFEELSRGVK